MNRLTLTISLLAFCISTPFLVVAGEPSPTPSVQAFSQSALLGMQLSVQDGSKAGKVPKAVASCVAALKPDSFYKVYEQILSNELSPSEQSSSDAFLSGVVGKKYSKHGLLQIYTSAGHQLPEPLPQFSDDEMNVLVNFSKTPAGQKLMVKKVLQSPSAAGLVNARIKSLVSACSAGA